MKYVATAVLASVLLFSGSAWSGPVELGVAGVEYMKVGQYEKAADKFTEAIAAAASDPYWTSMAYLYRGCAYFKLGKFAAAATDANLAGEAVFEKADLYGYESAVYAGLLCASTFLAQGNYPDARDAFAVVSFSPVLAAAFIPVVLEWVDKVVLAATRDKPLQVKALYKDLAEEIFGRLYGLLLERGWCRG